MIARKLFASAIWAISARLLCRAVDLITLLLLARLLTPASFGAVAIAMTLVQILEAVLELPVHTVLLCQDKLDRADFDTAFTLAVLRGACLGGVAILLAAPFARFYGDPHLLGLIAVLSLAPIFRGLSSPRLVLFTKELRLQGNFIIDIAGRSAACVLAAAVALEWQSEWAIVTSTVVAPVVMSLGSFILAPYRPRLSLARWSAFRGFFGWSSGGQLVSAINWQCDRLLLGHLVPRAALGQFSMASDLAAVPNQSLIVPLMTPTLSAFTQMKGDVQRTREAYRRFASAVLILGLPMLVGLSLTAQPLVTLLLGGKWTSASPLLQWLALETVPYLFVTPAWPLAIANGEVRMLFTRNVWELIIKIPLLAAAALTYGVPGVVASRVVMALITAGFNMRLTRRIIGLSVRSQIGQHWRPVAACIIMAVGVLTMRAVLGGAVALPLVSLCIEGVTGALIYGVSMLVLGFKPRQLFEASEPLGVPEVVTH